MFAEGLVINRILGAGPVIRIDRDEIIISNINGRLFALILNKTWKTSRMKNYLFTNVSRNSVRFYSFFALELFYIINNLIEDKTARFPINTLERLKTLLVEETWIKNTLEKDETEFNYYPTNVISFPLTEHQKEVIPDYFNTKKKYGLKGYLLAWDPGLGKTIGSLSLSLMIQNKTTIVICPKGALYSVWVNTLKENIRSKVKYWVSDMSLNDLTGKEDYIIIHYDYIAKFIQFYNKFKLSTTTVILDESHNFNELTAKRTRDFIHLCTNVLKTNDTLLLSGTPIKAISLEAIPLLRIIDPLFTPKVEELFKKLYSGNTNNATEILRYRLGIIQNQVVKNFEDIPDPIHLTVNVEFQGSEEFTLPKLKIKMQNFIAEREKYYLEKMPDAKSKFQEILDNYETTLTANERIDYQSYLESLNIVIRCNGHFSCNEDIKYTNRYEKEQILPTLNNNDKKTFKELKSIVKYYKLKIMGECLGQVIGGARIECHRKMAEHFDFIEIAESTKKKTIIFSSYTEVLLTVEKMLLKDNWKPLLIYGGTSQKVSTIVDSFDNDPLANPLIGTYASMSTAFRLTNADRMIVIDAPFRDYILNQSISRIWRMGQDSQVKIYYLRLLTNGIPNIADRNFDILEWSRKEVANITGVSTEVDFQSSEDISLGIEGYVNYLDTLMDASFFKKKTLFNGRQRS